MTDKIGDTSGNAQTVALSTAGQTVAPSTAGVITTHLPVNHQEKPEKFFGENLQDLAAENSFSYLTMMNLSKCLVDDPPTVREGDVDAAMTFNAIEAWKQSDYLCQNFIMNGLSDTLYAVYSKN